MTTLRLKPKRGGFLRPFGCGWFIREFLLGHGPGGSPIIDPNVGAPHSDIFYHYKMAIISATASDRATRQGEYQARHETHPISPDNTEKLTEKYTARSPYKAHGCHYHSLVVDFSNLRRLDWVEEFGRKKPSALQEHYAKGSLRRYYWLTQVGRTASEAAWANLYLALYG